MTTRFRVLGSNATYPTQGHPGSGYLVSVGPWTLLLDCGPGIFPELLALGVLPDAIVLSHVHHDHCSDVLALFNHLRFDRPEVRGIPLLAPAGVVDRLAAFAGAGPDHDFFGVFATRQVAPGDTWAGEGAALTFGEAIHPVPAVSVRVDAAVSIAYSGDTGPGGDLADVAHRADLLVCEATLQGVPGPGRYPYHLFAAEAGAISHAAGVERLLVTHVSPTLDPARSVEQAAAVFGGPVAHAEPGWEIAW